VFLVIHLSSVFRDGELVVNPHFMETLLIAGANAGGSDFVPVAFVARSAVSFFRGCVALEVLRFAYVGHVHRIMLSFVAAGIRFAVVESF
jgi:hypothetical protein